MREIALDTETTGLSPQNGDRIVEIGCVELINHMPSGRTYQTYLNPQKTMDPSAEEVHGLSNDFLKDQPLFKEIASEFLEFISDSPLIIHNAEFDIGFLNFELSRCGHPPLSMDRVIDTLPLARQKYPGAQASLDALCRRFGVDNSHRDLHGALIDADLLASVFVELKGGRQPGLELDDDIKAELSDNIPAEDTNLSGFILNKRPVRPARLFTVSDSETAAHTDLLTQIDNPIWLR